MSRPDPYAKYGGAIVDDPYAKYGGSFSKDDSLNSVRKAQATKYPTSAELGAKLGAPVELNNDQSEGVVLRSIEGVGRGLRNIVGMPLDMARAAFTPPSAEHPEEVALSGMYGPAGLLAHRMITKPAITEAQKAQAAPTKSETFGHGLAAAVPGVGPWAAGLGERAGSGDIAGAVSEAATTLAVPKAISATRAIPKTAEFVKRQIPGAALEPGMAMTKAIKPKASNLRWNADVDTALPDLKATEQMSGRPIENIEHLDDAVLQTKKRLWTEYEKRLGPNAQMGVDVTSVRDAMVRSLDRRTAAQNPSLAERVARTAATYEQPMTLAELEDYLQSANRELNTYYQKNKVGQRVAEADPEKAATVAEVNALRQTLYDSLDRLTGPGVVDLKRRYGALSNIQAEVARRKLVYERQQPASLAEELGTIHGGGKILHGAMSLNPVQMAAGIGEVGLAKYLKHLNSTDTLIQRAMKNVEARAPEAGSQQWQPAGLLNRGPVLSGPGADESFVRGVSAEYGNPAVRGLLEEPATRVDVQRTIQPSSGRVYEMPPKPPLLLTEGQKLLPENAGSPYVTPLRESLFDQIRRRTQSGRKKNLFEQLRDRGRR